MKYLLLTILGITEQQLKCAIGEHELGGYQYIRLTGVAIFVTNNAVEIPWCKHCKSLYVNM